MQMKENVADRVVVGVVQPILSDLVIPEDHLALDPAPPPRAQYVADAVDAATMM